MFKWVPRRPKKKTGTYLKYGFIVTEHENHRCPRCGSVLNAGPDYQPKYCDQCGQKVTFKDVIWNPDKELRILPSVQRSVTNE